MRHQEGVHAAGEVVGEPAGHGAVHLDGVEVAGQPRAGLVQFPGGGADEHDLDPGVRVHPGRRRQGVDGGHVGRTSAIAQVPGDLADVGAFSGHLVDVPAVGRLPAAGKEYVRPVEGDGRVGGGGEPLAEHPEGPVGVQPDDAGPFAPGNAERVGGNRLALHVARPGGARLELGEDEREIDRCARSRRAEHAPAQAQSTDDDGEQRRASGEAVPNGTAGQAEDLRTPPCDPHRGHDPPDSGRTQRGQLRSSYAHRLTVCLGRCKQQ